MGDLCSIEHVILDSCPTCYCYYEAMDAQRIDCPEMCYLANNPERFNEPMELIEIYTKENIQQLFLPAMITASPFSNIQPYLDPAPHDRVQKLLFKNCKGQKFITSWINKEDDIFDDGKLDISTVYNITAWAGLGHN